MCSIAFDAHTLFTAVVTVLSISNIVGGLAAVIYTDAVQTLIMTIGATVLTIISK